MTWYCLMPQSDELDKIYISPVVDGSKMYANSCLIQSKGFTPSAQIFYL